MKYMLKYCAFLVLLLVLTGTSCRKEPNFDLKPQINFEEIQEKIFVDENRIKHHQISIVVYYQDGDGNLGLSADPPAPFNQPPYDKNFIVKLLVKEPQQDGTSEFEEYQFPVAGFDLSGRFPRISADERPEPLEGKIKYTFDITSEFPNLAGKVAKFDIFIYDRTLPVPLQSNTVTTNEITLLR